jgi:hypothetical protein
MKIDQNLKESFKIDIYCLFSSSKVKRSEFQKAFSEVNIPNMKKRGNYNLSKKINL